MKATKETKRMSKTKLWIGIVSVFLLGAIIGGLVTTTLIRHHVLRLRRHGPPRMHSLIENRLTKDLDLTDEQRASIREILDEFEPRFHGFDRDIRMEIDAIRDEMNERIREVLTPEQRAKFDENLERMRSRFRRPFGRGGGFDKPPPPGGPEVPPPGEGEPAVAPPPKKGIRLPPVRTIVMVAILIGVIITAIFYFGRRYIFKEKKEAPAKRPAVS